MSKEIMEILSPILGNELPAAITKHAKRTVKKPLTVYAAKLQVQEYIKTGQPIAAAEMQILRGWQAIRADWYFNDVEKQKRNTPPVPVQETREEYLRRAIKANEWDGKPSTDRRVNDLIRGALVK